jgi:hypothetical protein
VIPLAELEDMRRGWVAPYVGVIAIAWLLVMIIWVLSIAWRERDRP